MKLLTYLYRFFILVILGVAVYWFYQAYAAYNEPTRLVRSLTVPKASPSAETIVEASLKAVREQNRIIPMTASYVAVVTTQEDHLWGMMQSRKTLVMPGRVRYEIDLARLTRRDLQWNDQTKVLRVHLPAIEVSAPEIDLAAVQQFSDGVMTSLSSVDRELDAINQRVGQGKLSQQARQPEMIRMARQAASRAVEQTFSMPMRAAGLQARVEVSFDQWGAK